MAKILKMHIKHIKFFLFFDVDFLIWHYANTDKLSPVVSCAYLMKIYLSMWLYSALLCLFDEDLFEHMGYYCVCAYLIKIYWIIWYIKHFTPVKSACHPSWKDVYLAATKKRKCFYASPYTEWMYKCNAILPLYLKPGSVILLSHRCLMDCMLNWYFLSWKRIWI